MVPCRRIPGSSSDPNRSERFRVWWASAGMAPFTQFGAFGTRPGWEPSSCVPQRMPTHAHPHMSVGPHFAVVARNADSVRLTALAPGGGQSDTTHASSMCWRSIYCEHPPFRHLTCPDRRHRQARDNSSQVRGHRRAVCRLPRRLPDRAAVRRVPMGRRAGLRPRRQVRRVERHTQ